jgi:hypothetical protein
MQGKGGQQSLTQVFGNDQPQQPQKKEAATDFNPNKTAELPPEENPNSSDADRTFQKTMNGQLKAAKQQAIKQISHQQQAEMQAQGWKFDRQPDGNWSASPPKNGGSQSSQKQQESKKSKKR